MFKAVNSNTSSAKSSTKSSPFHMESDQEAFIQPKLNIGKPNDRYEVEADHVADKVVNNMSTTQHTSFFSPVSKVQTKQEADIQRQVAEEEQIQEKPIVDSITPFVQLASDDDEAIQQKCSACEHEETVQSKAESKPGNTQNIENSLKNSHGRGNPMPKSVKNDMESGFGADFSNVNIHTDAKAVQMSKQLNAQAFTHGSDIYFNLGKFNPSSTQGKHLLAHELTHTVQQGKTKTTLQREIDPMGGRGSTQSMHRDLAERFAGDSAMPYMPGSQYSSGYNHWLITSSPQAIRATEIRNDVLGRLNGSGTGFTARIRSLTADEAALLVEDPLFWQEIKRIFRGRALWAVFKIIYFNNVSREPETRLTVSFRANNPNGFKDALALVLADRTRIRTPDYFSMLRTAVRQEFSSSPQLPSILQMINNRSDPRNVQQLSVSYSEVHYERDATTGNYQLATFGLNGQMTVYQTGNELRVIVKIGFVDGNNPAQSYYMFPDSGTPDKWQRAITSFWNDKFIITNGIRNLNFVVSPMFYYETSSPVDKTVRVMESDTSTCWAGGSPGRANAGCWFTSSADDTISHEFGHIIGASDEYNLPGAISEIPASMLQSATNPRGLAPEDLEFSTVEGITGSATAFKTDGHDVESLMGSHHADSNVYARHIRRLVRAINNNLPTGVPHYTIREL